MHDSRLALIFGSDGAGTRHAEVLAMSTSLTRMTYAHLVARADRLPIPLTDHEVASWLWPRLQRRFALAISCVLMLDHLHLATPTRDADATRERLAQLLGGLGRSGGTRGRIRFEPIPKVLVEDDPIKLGRIARYGALNPKRAGLVDDPLAWEWSTHRDVMGAVARPWVTADRLAKALGRERDGFVAWWHRYVACDDDMIAGADRLPVPAVPSRFAKHPLEDVADAVARSMHARVSDIQKRGPVRALFLVVAPLVGWTGSSVLAEYCGVTTRAIQKSFHRVPPVAIEAALLCLGDPRLRIGQVAARQGRSAA